LAEYFETSAFSPNAPGQFGNAGRNLLIGPGFARVDLGLFKKFPVYEDHALQFRAEIFNLLNRANFRNPDANLASAGFGQILTADAPRIVQLGLKYIF